MKKIICLGLLCYATICSVCVNKDSVVTEKDVKPTSTLTPVPTVINTPTPTSTPAPTIAPQETLTPTPIIKEKQDLPDVSKIVIEEALKRVEKYKQENKPTLYNTYSEEELDLLFRVVEAEVTDGDVESKSHVASVIFNRMKDGWYDGDLTKNLMAKRQFEVVTNGRYKKITVTDGTIEACEIAFEKDTAQGALFFDSTKGKSWAAKKRTFLFKDRVGHWFYK